jgi:spectinomycin phosphotransferase
MLLPLHELEAHGLRSLIYEQFGGARGVLQFTPLGEDSWCYRLGDLWISVRRDLRGHHPGAYEAAYALQEAGLDFILAPLVGADGRVVHSVADRPVVVFPYLPVKQLAARDGTTCIESVAAMIDKVHSTAVDIELPRETFSLSFDTELDLSIALADNAAVARGPYAERLCRLMRAHRSRICALRGECAGLRQECLSSATPFVLTHGEPSAANILRCGTRLLLADWGGASLAPPEKDWFHVRRNVHDIATGRPAFMRFYDVRWILSEIAEYVAILSQTRNDNIESRAMWQRLTHYLPEN